LEISPRGVLNTPDEFGAVIAFLASEEAAGVSGISLSVDAASERFLF
jgi:NAD(P)-dependent dehydrogenase (short-subunit alcohol dehydrogenase family)